MLEFKIVTENDIEVFDLAELKKQDNSEFIWEDISFEQAFDFIESYIFGKCDCILAIKDSIPVWYAIWLKQYENYWSQKIFVLKNFRRLWIWTNLKKRQIQIARDKWCTCISASLLKENIWSKRIQEKVLSTLDIYPSWLIISNLKLS